MEDALPLLPRALQARRGDAEAPREQLDHALDVEEIQRAGGRGPVQGRPARQQEAQPGLLGRRLDARGALPAEDAPELEDGDVAPSLAQVRAQHADQSREHERLAQHRLLRAERVREAQRLRHEPARGLLPDEGIRDRFLHARPGQGRAQVAVAPLRGPQALDTRAGRDGGRDAAQAVVARDLLHEVDLARHVAAPGGHVHRPGLARLAHREPEPAEDPARFRDGHGAPSTDVMRPGRRLTRVRGRGAT